MVCLRNGSAWRSKGRGPGEKPREVKVGPTGGSSRSLEAPGSHGEVLLEGGVVRPVLGPLHLPLLSPLVQQANLLSPTTQFRPDIF